MIPSFEYSSRISGQSLPDYLVEVGGTFDIGDGGLALENLSDMLEICP